MNHAGTRVDGPTRVTAAPIFVRAWIFERATRLKRMSPRIATFRPRSEPRCSFIVKVSSSPWVGCSCAPSPALMTGMSRIARR